MKFSSSAYLFFLFALVAFQVSAQRAEEILEKHFAAAGTEKLVSCESYTIKANVSQMGLAIPMVMNFKRPDKFRLEMDIPGQKIIQAYDGKEGWMFMPQLSDEVLDLKGEQLEQARSQVNMEGELFNYLEKGYTVKLDGKRDTEGQECYVINLLKQDGSRFTYHINSTTFLVAKIQSSIRIMGQSVETEQRMSNYKAFQGIVMPMTIQTDLPTGTAELAISDIMLNNIAGDELFQRPVKK